MNSDDIERSGSGEPIWRYPEREREFTLPESFGANLQEIENHLERHVGTVEGVFHEILSDLIHLDVLQIKATGGRPYNLLVTSGVSDRPMNVPEGMNNASRIELLIALSSEWPLTQDAFEQEANYWPVRSLKAMGRFPHEYETWLGYGHSMPNGDPPEPIANTGFVGFVLLPPYWLEPDFFRLQTADDETIMFYQLVPLYPEEMDLKLNRGVEELEKLFEKHNVDFVLNPRRKNVAKRKRWFW